MLQEHVEQIVEIETHLDHLTGEELGQAIQMLDSMPEVLDILVLTGIGKKNRPMQLLRALCLPKDSQRVSEAIFIHTHTLGLRRKLVERVFLHRESGMCDLYGEEVPAKAYVCDGKRFVRPEADAVADRAKSMQIGAPALRFLPR